MRFLTDENVYASIVGALRNTGHDVLDVKEHRLQGVEDDSLISLAIKEDRIIVTMDRDFGNILLYPPGSHSGIIILRFSLLTVEAATNTFKKFLQTVDPKELHGSLVIVEPHRVRLRRVE